MHTKRTLSQKIGLTLKIVAVILAALIVAAFVFCAIPYPIRHDAVQPAFSQQLPENLQVTELDGATAFVPDEPLVGLIFYPGAKVSSEAYEELMYALAEQNILTVLLDVPLNLAFFVLNAPDGIREQFPQVPSWYIGGHSMGAAVAGMYLQKHEREFDGLVLLGGFVTNDLSDTDLTAISIYGSEDGVLFGGLYEKYRSYLPRTLHEYVIEGGNHSGFAGYDHQPLDYEARISKREQMEQTAEYIRQTIVSK